MNVKEKIKFISNWIGEYVRAAWRKEDDDGVKWMDVVGAVDEIINDRDIPKFEDSRIEITRSEDYYLTNAEYKIFELQGNKISSSLINQPFKLIEISFSTNISNHSPLLNMEIITFIVENRMVKKLKELKKLMNVFVSLKLMMF